VIAPHHGYIAFSIAHDDITPAPDQDPEPMGTECGKSEEAMESDQNHVAAERREKSC